MTTDVSSDVRWLTYDEIAQKLRVARESARQLAIRRRWPRRKGNDGKARVGVPEEALHPSDGTSDVTGQDPSDGPSDVTGRDTAVVRVLTRHISRLECEITILKQERETERTRLQAEIDEMRRERDQERINAVALQVEAAPAPALQTTVEALKGALETERGRVADHLRVERERLNCRVWWRWRR